MYCFFIRINHLISQSSFFVRVKLNSLYLWMHCTFNNPQWGPQYSIVASYKGRILVTNLAIYLCKTGEVLPYFGQNTNPSLPNNPPRPSGERFIKKRKNLQILVLPLQVRKALLYQIGCFFSNIVQTALDPPPRFYTIMKQIF